MEKTINKTISINATPAIVWATLTNPELMRFWIAASRVNVVSDWKIGAPILFQGSLHGVQFENKGTILRFETEKVFEYNYWSALSRHADKPENYTVIHFRLTRQGDTTSLDLTQSNFAAETSYDHFNFYWNSAIVLIKRLSEQA
jgi:uncharacterized protein YndB with AHSA1/START domain